MGRAGTPADRLGRCLDRRAGTSAGEEIHNGHPDGDSIGDLGLDDALRPVCDLWADLDPFVHWAGMHHKRSEASFCDPLACDAPLT